MKVTGEGQSCSTQVLDRHPLHLPAGRVSSPPIYFQWELSHDPKSQHPTDSKWQKPPTCSKNCVFWAKLCKKSAWEKPPGVKHQTTPKGSKIQRQRRPRGTFPSFHTEPRPVQEKQGPVPVRNHPRFPCATCARGQGPKYKHTALSWLLQEQPRLVLPKLQLLAAQTRPGWDVPSPLLPPFLLTVFVGL